MTTQTHEKAQTMKTMQVYQIDVVVAGDFQWRNIAETTIGQDGLVVDVPPGTSSVRINPVQATTKDQTMACERQVLLDAAKMVEQFAVDTAWEAARAKAHAFEACGKAERMQKIADDAAKKAREAARRAREG
jgi:hypothetical protein